MSHAVPWHVVAHALPGQRPLGDPASAWWLMRRLRAAWPEALAACVMPDHLHLVVEARRGTDLAQRLAHLLGGFAQHLKVAQMWRPVPIAEAIADAKHLLRVLRYVHLNPCRSRLVDDPLCWPWSTHRGVCGAEPRPWVSADRLAASLGRPAEGFVPWFHRYVSGDPTVGVAGTPPPEAVRARSVPAIPLATILQAAVAATIWEPTAVTTHAFVLLARHQGWSDPAVVGRAAQVSARHACRLARQREDGLLAAAALCLGDPRLRSGSVEMSWKRTFGVTRCPGVDEMSAWRTI